MENAAQETEKSIFDAIKIDEKVSATVLTVRYGSQTISQTPKLRKKPDFFK